MNARPQTVADDMVVSLAYTLESSEGVALDSTADDEVLQFIQGQGQIVDGLESALYGMGVGEEKKVVVEPDQAYGTYLEDNLEVMPRSAFPEDLNLEAGVALQLRDEDSDESYTATVTEVDDEKVVLDFNHPLAGETLHFHVKVIDLRPATRSELEHGHVHDDPD